MQDYDIPLHDIKTIVDVQEYSLYAFLGVGALGIFLACALLYLLYIWFKRRRAFNLKQEHKKLLLSLELSDAKEAAYAITRYGATFRNDTPRHQEMYKNLTQRLEAYKYKKEVEVFDKETLGYIELYKEMCDV